MSQRRAQVRFARAMWRNGDRATRVGMVRELAKSRAAVTGYFVAVIGAGLAAVHFVG